MSLKIKISKSNRFRNSPVERIPNLGPVSRESLKSVGVDSLKDLQRLGAIAVYRKTKVKGFPVTLNLLWALEGALQERPWYFLSFFFLF